MIDHSDEEESTKKCFKYQHKLTGNLNIVYNASNSMLCLWNKHQIFIHERLNFKAAAKIIVPEFLLKETLIVNSHLICLDYSGNVHLISLKFKHSTAKRLRSNFHPRDQNILTIKNINDDVISLKFENSYFFICSYKNDSDFQLLKKQQVHLQDTYHNGPKCLLFLYALSSHEFDTVKEVFNNKGSWRNQYLLIITFDKLTVFGCLFSSQSTEEVNLIKLYTCPTEISDIKILYRNHPEIIIGLVSGTLLRLTLNIVKSCDIVHLNTCIEKFLEISDNIIYTDGLSMWKVDQAFSNITFRQFFIKQVKDFVKCSDQLICTTYSNYIYIFSVDDESCYTKQISNDEYCSAENLLSNTEYLCRILEEVNKIEDLVRKIVEEKNYITTLALSNKEDVMDSIIKYKITVFDDYEDLLKENNALTFTDDPEDIFEEETYFVLVNLYTTHLQQNFKDIISNLFGDLRIHITLSTNENIIKTSTLKIEEELKKIDIVVALKNRYIDLQSKFFVNIQLVTRIPGVFDKKQNLWTCLHKKHIELTSEHFMRTRRTSKHSYLKQNVKDLSELILETAINQFDTLFTLTKRPNIAVSSDWTFCVRLPNNYKEIFQNDDFYKCFNKRKRLYLKEHTSEEFIKSQSTLQFIIVNEKTEVEIFNDGFTSPVLKITGANAKVAQDIRYLFSNLLYNDFSGLQQDMFVNCSLYSTLEALQREIKNYIDNEKISEEFIDLHNTFQRNIISSFPIYKVFYFVMVTRHNFMKHDWVNK